MWQGAAGLIDEDGNPATTDSRYPIASVTKLFTATVTMRLVESGRLSVDSRLVDLLPANMTQRLHVLDGVDYTDQITVEHLLDHTSGLPDYYEEAPRGELSPQDRLLSGEDAPVPFEEVLRVVREELEPHFPPQAHASPKPKARYTDTSYQLLGAVIEHVTNDSLRHVFETTIFDVLGLDDTSSYPNSPRSGRSAQPDARIWSKDTLLNPHGALVHQVADGGIISTLSDQVRFMRALASGMMFDDQATWRRMYERTHRIFFPVDYGLGIMRYAPPRWMSPLSPITPLLGHSGSTATWLFYAPTLDVVLAGTFDVAQPPLPFRFLPRVLREVEKTP